MMPMGVIFRSAFTQYRPEAEVRRSLRTARAYVRDAELLKITRGLDCYDSAETSVWPLRRLKEAGGATPGSSA